jgi:hypothetical protein
MMLESSIVKALIGFGFLFFGFNQVYIMKKKVKGRNNSPNWGNGNEYFHYFVFLKYYFLYLV